MDERLEKALEFANYRTTLSMQKRNIRARMQVLQTLHYKGGSFIANELTISFVNTLIQLTKTSAIINEFPFTEKFMLEYQQLIRDGINSVYNSDIIIKILSFW